MQQTQEKRRTTHPRRRARQERALVRRKAELDAWTQGWPDFWNGLREDWIRAAHQNRAMKDVSNLMRKLHPNI